MTLQILSQTLSDTDLDRISECRDYSARHGSGLIVPFRADGADASASL